jgi:hypothetical protein
MRTNVHGNGNRWPVRALLLLPSSICGTEMSRCVMKRVRRWQPIASDGRRSERGWWRVARLFWSIDPSSIP